MATHSRTLALKNSMDGGAWWATVCGVAKSQIRLSNFSLGSHLSCSPPTLNLSSSMFLCVSFLPSPLALPTPA